MNSLQLNNVELNPVREIYQVIGCLMQDPTLIKNKKYKLLRQDFPEMFHKSIFASIHNLVLQDVKEIDEIAIDNYLSNYEEYYQIFQDNNGIQWLNKAREHANLDNFDYNYQQIKKFTLLRTYEEQGFYIGDIYNVNTVNVEEQERMQERFDLMTTEDILRHMKTKILSIEEDFTVDDSTKAKKAGDGAEHIKERFKDSPLMGLGLESKVLTTVSRGALKKRFMISSSDTGGGRVFISCKTL